jgi:hypothetical protein
MKLVVPNKDRISEKIRDDEKSFVNLKAVKNDLLFGKALLDIVDPQVIIRTYEMFSFSKKIVLIFL